MTLSLIITQAERHRGRWLQVQLLKASYTTPPHPPLLSAPPLLLAGLNVTSLRTWNPFSSGRCKANVGSVRRVDGFITPSSSLCSPLITISLPDFYAAWSPSLTMAVVKYSEAGRAPVYSVHAGSPRQSRT
ncbi:unnamed protein product [Pleuronectes platessa]|uniref:Uncharacterized protein n=1 Tax=Pleuronectes platessa TaxID=8262 RepID=A0A9N7YDS0_PLEPL|nr:unnamed protein product [Pleuronectes platessa]